MFTISAPSRPRLVLAVVAGVVAALGGAVANAALSTTPATLTIDSVASGVPVPSDLPDGAEPYVVVKAGGTITVTVSFRDAAGAPAAFTKDTKLTVSSNVGTLTNTTGLALAGQSSAEIRTSVASPVNRVVLTVRAGTGAKALSGTSYVPGGRDLRFDVLTDVSPLLPGADGSSFQEGFGGANGCAEATEAAPVCEVVILPRGSASQVLLTVGPCDPNLSSPYAPCVKGPKGVVGGAVTQALFAQASTPYSTTNPATVVVKCDKTLCGTGPLRSHTVLWSLGGNGALVAADPCPAKNTMAASGKPCVDYVQSTRDGSADSHYYLLTDGDIRTGIG